MPSATWVGALGWNRQRSALERAPGSERKGRASTTLAAVSELLRDRPLPLTEQQRRADHGALDLLRIVVRKDASEARAQVTIWASAIAEKSRTGAALTVLEHTALSYILRSGLFDTGEHSSAEDRAFEKTTQDLLTASLRASWKALTGAEPSPAKLLGRLPKLVLRKASREARAFHAASFQPAGSLKVPAELKARIEASSLLRDYVPENADILVMSATLLATAFSTTGAAVIGTGILSYSMFSLTESILHRFGGHQPDGGLAQWILAPIAKDAPWLTRKVHAFLVSQLGHTLEVARLSHKIVHHGLTFRSSFVQMFDSPEHKKKVDAFLAAQRKDLADDVLNDDYGTTIDFKGALNILKGVAPQTAAMVAAGLLFGAPIWCALPLVLLWIAYPASIALLHPKEHVDQETAKALAPPLVRAILQTRWAAWVVRNHALHHKGDCNFNLSFPGADALLGRLVQPNLEDLFQMQDEGALHH